MAIHKRLFVHPSEDVPPVWLPLPGVPEPSARFAAYGYVPVHLAPNCTRVRVLLRDNLEKLVGSQEVLCHPTPASERFWSAALYDVPKDRDNYYLELYDYDAGDVYFLGKSDNFIIERITSDKSKTSYPANNQTVTPSFTAYGPTNASSVTAKMIRDTTVHTSTAHIFNSAWYAPFQNIEAGGNWTLNVYEGSVLQDTKIGIIVQA
jgi:hypothetical protein